MFVLNVSEAGVWFAASVTVPAVPSKIRLSLVAAVESDALPVALLLKVVPHVALPPMPLPAPAVVSQAALPPSLACHVCRAG